MRIKKLKKSSTAFREIIEINNKKKKLLSVLLTRALIRYTARFFKYNLSIFVLKKYLSLTEVFFKKKSYNIHILKINIFRIECMVLLAKKKINEYIKKRIEWGIFELKNSPSTFEKKAALQYLNILKIQDHYQKKLKTSSKHKCQKNYKNKKKFYIYGPNSLYPPNTQYSDSTIVLTKMIDYDISNFKKSILILNFYTSNQLSQKDKKLLLKKYNKIYLSLPRSKIKYPFKKFSNEIGGNIASPMALGRILNTLSKTYSKSEFIIEGFDLYLSKKSYSNYIKTAFPLKMNKLTEHLVCQSIFDHEPLFNFLYIKNIVSKIKIKNSSEFLSIVNLNGEEYLKRLNKCRDFRTLI